jgi:hypothetical protein
MTSEWIMPFSDGSFQRLPEYEPGAIDADWLYVRAWDDELFTEAGDIIDCVAWAKGTVEPWWCWRGIAGFLGEAELRLSWWERRPARMVETPSDFLACHGEAFCVLDWSADIDLIIGDAPSVSCSTERLRAKLIRTLMEQALPKFPITLTTKAAA